jgi:uroporphyrinogen III methyltransferase/synthase
VSAVRHRLRLGGASLEIAAVIGAAIEARIPGTKFDFIQLDSTCAFETLQRPELDIVIASTSDEPTVPDLDWFRLSERSGISRLLLFRAGDAFLERLRVAFLPVVTFIGAGPGSAGLLTLAGATALHRAEVCLHDALIDPAVLDHLPSDALRVDVGKRCGRHPMKQDEINALLLLHARRGLRVTRLKGGDPGIFGRLAEEIEALERHGLGYRVIPGVSSLQAATTGTGMLLTRRGVSRGFTAVTPRIKGHELGSIRAEARAGLPLAIIMGARALDDVVAQLRADGRPEDEPAAVVLAAASEEEEIVAGTLATIAALVEPAAAERPGLLLVGEITRHRFRSLGALAGRRVLLTASEAVIGKASALVRDFGGIPIARPLIRLVLEEEAIRRLSRLDTVDWIALTSPSAVRAFGEALRRAGLDPRRVPRIMTCGPGSAAELRMIGWQSDLSVDHAPGAPGLTETVRGALSAPVRILRFRSDRADAQLTESLAAAGHTVEDLILYRNEFIEPGPLPRFDTVFFASASAVESFVAAWGRVALAEKLIGAIGAPTAVALARHGVATPVIGRIATIAGGIEALAGAAVGHDLGFAEVKNT